MKNTPSGSPGTPDGSDEALICGTCGRSPTSADQATARLTWSRGIESGRIQWTCDTCSRDHLRSIEGKLDSAWW